MYNDEFDFLRQCINFTDKNHNGIPKAQHKFKKKKVNQFDQRSRFSEAKALLIYNEDRASERESYDASVSLHIVAAMSKKLSSNLSIVEKEEKPQSAHAALGMPQCGPFSEEKYLRSAFALGRSLRQLSFVRSLSLSLSFWGPRPRARNRTLSLQIRANCSSLPASVVRTSYFVYLSFVHSVNWGQSFATNARTLE